MGFAGWWWGIFRLVGFCRLVGPAGWWGLSFCVAGWWGRQLGGADTKKSRFFFAGWWGVIFLFAGASVIMVVLGMETCALSYCYYTDECLLTRYF